MKQSDCILKAIGAEAMQRLVQEFGGHTIYIPQDLPEPDRSDEIHTIFSETLKAGASSMTAYEKCADVFGISTRTAQRIISER